jgi:hypothetical protein
MEDSEADALLELEDSKVLYTKVKYAENTWRELPDGSEQRVIESVTLHFDTNPELTLGYMGEYFWEIKE